MQDKSDVFTVDFLDSPSPGRPRTSTPEKKKLDAAARARRHRLKKSALVVPGEVHDKLFAVVQQFTWLEHDFLADGSFYESWSPESAQQHRVEMAVYLSEALCSLGMHDLAGRLTWLTTSRLD